MIVVAELHPEITHSGSDPLAPPLEPFNGTCVDDVFGTKKNNFPIGMFIACTDTISLANNFENTLRTIGNTTVSNEPDEPASVDSLSSEDAWFSYNCAMFSFT